MAECLVDKDSFGFKSMAVEDYSGADMNNFATGVQQGVNTSLSGWQYCHKYGKLVQLDINLQLTATAQSVIQQNGILLSGTMKSGFRPPETIDMYQMGYYRQSASVVDFIPIYAHFNKNGDFTISVLNEVKINYMARLHFVYLAA